MQQGITVKRLYDAIKKAVKANTGEFEIKKATLWTFSNKYNQPVTFEVVQRAGHVYLGISIGEESQARGGRQVIYYLQDLVLDNITIIFF